MPGGIDNPVIGYAAFGLIKFAGYSLFVWRVRGDRLRPSLPAKLGDDGRIAEDRTCIECGYNLRSLDTKSVCPECGTKVAESLGPTARPSRGKQKPDPLLVGLIRTIIGMMFGAAYWFLVGSTITRGSIFIALLAGLIPIRIFEWWLIVWIFFNDRLQTASHKWRFVTLGTFVSYGLDLPAVLGVCVAGGLWIC
ncbi:MAG: hypothetical protein V3T70_09800 [Phycisphaerae bacterium]